MNRPTEVTLADETTRPITTTYDNGWGCPYCGTGVLDGAPGCPNPACVARPGLSVQEVRDQLARWEAADQARAHEARRAEIDRAAVETSRRKREERWAVLVTQAAKQGACLTCLAKSSWQYGTPRFVRHRTADFHTKDR